MVQIVDCQHLANASVMVVDGLLRVHCRIEVAQPGLGTPHERSVAEDYPGFFGAGSEWLPKNPESRWGVFASARHSTCIRVSGKQQPRNHENRNPENSRQHNR